MNFITKCYYLFRRVWKSVSLYFMLAGPGLVVMIADNDAGGITTYAATGAKYGYHLIWFLLVLIPVAYYVQEMTVRLGAVTKRGHAEAIFDGFGSFWGWFSLLDLMLKPAAHLFDQALRLIERFGAVGKPFHNGVADQATFAIGIVGQRPDKAAQPPVDRRRPAVVFLPAGLEQRHRDQLRPAKGVGGHGLVALF